MNNDVACSTRGTFGLICGLPISLDTQESVLSAIERGIEERSRTASISITNTESMYWGLKQPFHGATIRAADYSLCDGVGVSLAGAFWGLNISRYNGPILQLDCIRVGAQKEWKHFFYGGKEGVAEEMARRFKAAYPKTKVVGIYCPPFRELTSEEDEDLVRQINESGADFVWVGLGLRKQERWIAEHRDRLQVPWLVGVGAAFDYHSGAIPWAPKFVRALGLEWLFRLILQPKLRAKRYWWSAVWTARAAVSGLVRGRFLRPMIVICDGTASRTIENKEV